MCPPAASSEVEHAQNACIHFGTKGQEAHVQNLQGPPWSDFVLEPTGVSGAWKPQAGRETLVARFVITCADKTLKTIRH